MKKQDSNSEIQQQPNLEQKIAFVDYEEILRQQDLVPIRPLGRGAFGSVYEAYDRKFGIVAVKIIKKEKFDIRELEASEIIHNFMTLNIIAKQSQFSLPSCILRALMNQILEGMRVFHSADLVHRDIKCDNILLHSPPGSGLVYAKISDFGFAKKVDLTNKQTQQAGTVPFMSPEQFLDNPIITKKVDIYALGITFYKLITHKYPVNERNFKEQRKKMSQLKCIKRPSEIKDNLLWDLLSNMLEFDPNKRFSAAQALKHPYFTSPEALADISKEQEKLTNQVGVINSQHIVTKTFGSNFYK
ncbi:MAG: putative serine/threonine protein kinase [Streblomastix strix]|uniref:Putative serine/threonine protein kinase n=1 Tax=Streblomastix strix TaxID=222440 RepID=A0A5J4WTW9_9EUKA|nr:MAG: putative serine/threonine protein kinase [Streblomastix strix]